MLESKIIMTIENALAPTRPDLITARQWFFPTTPADADVGLGVSPYKSTLKPENSLVAGMAQCRKAMDATARRSARRHPAATVPVFARPVRAYLRQNA